MKSFRTLSGLGDAVYSAPIVTYFAKAERVHVSTHYPEVFQHIENVEVNKDSAPTPTRLRYSRNAGHNQYGDYCRAAGLYMLPFSLPWRTSADIEFLFPKHVTAKAGGRKVCLIKEPSSAHMHRNRGDFAFAPNPMVMQRWMLDNRAEFFFISVEHDTNTIKSRLVGIDARIQALSVTDYISLCSVVDHIASQVSHLVPLAQALGKPLTMFMPEKPFDGLFKNMTPDMVLVPREFAPSPVEVVG
jgi:hypothetical protein